MDNTDRTRTVISEAVEEAVYNLHRRQREATEEMIRQVSDQLGKSVEELHKEGYLLTDDGQVGNVYLVNPQGHKTLLVRLEWPELPKPLPKWETAIFEGMDSAPKDRPFLSFDPHCTGIDRWTHTIWRETFPNWLPQDPRFERLPSHGSTFTHWCHLPGDPTK